MSRAHGIAWKCLAAGAALVAAGCGDDGGKEPVAAAGLEVAVVPLVESSAVGDAIWDLEAVDSAGEVLWQKRLLSSQYGDGRGGLSYVGECDPAHSPTTLTLKLIGLYGAPVDVSAAGAFGDAAASVGATALAGPTPTVTRSVECKADADVFVRFDVAQVVPGDIADLGFFDRAAAVSGVACSVGVQCCAEGAGACEPILLLPDETGARGRTVLVKAACEKVGDAGAPDLMMDAVVLSCSGAEAADVTLSPDRAGAGACAAGDVAACAAASVRQGFEVDDALYQYLVMSGAEGDGRFSVNQALGLRAGAAGCRLRTRFAVDDAANAEDGAHEGTIPAAVLYPAVEIDVALDGCQNAAIDFSDASAPVHLEYLFDSAQSTSFPFHVEGGEVTAY